MKVVNEEEWLRQSQETLDLIPLIGVGCDYMGDIPVRTDLPDTQSKRDSSERNQIGGHS